jgi:hypothetical protein
MKIVNRVKTVTNSNGHVLTETKKTKKVTKKLRFQVEYFRNRQNVITIHTKKRFPRADTDPLTFIFETWGQKSHKHPLIGSIRQIKGVVRVSSEHYELHIEKAKLFSWDEILPRVRLALKEHFADGKELDEIPNYKSLADQLPSLHL